MLTIDYVRPKARVTALCGSAVRIVGVEQYENDASITTSRLSVELHERRRQSRPHGSPPGDKSLGDGFGNRSACLMLVVHTAPSAVTLQSMVKLKPLCFSLAPRHRSYAALQVDAECYSTRSQQDRRSHRREGKFRSLCASEELRDIPTDHIGARLSFPRYPRSAADLLHGHAHPMAQRSTSLGT